MSKNKNKKQNTVNNFLHINIAEMYDIWYNRGEEMAKYDSNMQDNIRIGACMVTNLRAEFDKALSEVDANKILKSSMKEIVSNMINDEELCVLFYNKEEEEKKIWDSIRMEEAEKAEKIGIEKGVAQGIEQNRKEMVASMKEKGISMEVIAEISNLSIEEVEKLLEE